MDLRSIANGVSTAVNPNIIVSVQVSIGSTVGAGLRQVPAYAEPVTGPAQIQALDGSTLQHLDGLNIQGDLRTIFFRGALASIVRPDKQGGDLVTIAPSPITPAALVGTWLITKVLESWPLWTKAVIVLQTPGVQS